MFLSHLQKYMLMRLYQESRTLKKEAFLDFYRTTSIAQDIALKDIAKSIDRLVSRDLVKANGVKTAKKWYTNSVMVTSKGAHIARELLSNQQRLPFKKYGKQKTHKGA